jgi:glycosyltransferase involved in cell wall biosynthesis
MRVLHVITTISRGGAENHLLELVRGQRARGLEVAVAYLKGDGYWNKAFAGMGATVAFLGLRRYGEAAPALRLFRLFSTFRPDIVHAHMPPAELYSRIALLLAGSSGPSMVISKHIDEHFFRGPGSALIARFVARRASRIIAISEAVNRYTRDMLALEPGRISSIHYGIDVEPYQSQRIKPDAVAALRREWGVPEQGWVIGTVARLVPQKALHVMLAAYATYRDQATQESRLVLVGRGPLEAELKALADRLGLANVVVWAGFKEEIPVAMNAFDCFALTSLNEGFGLVLLEAMAAARPVVATAVSAIPEIVSDGETGILCAPQDSDSVARALLRMEKVHVRRQLGSAGAARAASIFTLDHMLDKTLSVYRECL